MGNSLGTLSALWGQHPGAAIAVAVIIATAAYAFLGAKRSTAPRGGYSVVLKNEKKGDNESASRRHRLAPDQETKVPVDAPHVTTLHAIIKEAVSKRPHAKALGSRPIINIIKETTKVHGEDKVWEYQQLGAYTWHTYSEVLELVCAFAAGLESLGMRKGDNLGIFEETRLEWNVSAHGAWRQGMAILTVYANLGEDALVHALNLGEVGVLVLNSKALPTILAVADKIPSLRTVIYTDDVDQKSLDLANQLKIQALSFKEVIDLGKDKPINENPPAPEDVAMIMFTSGTTGLPKGVVLSHSNVIGALAGGCQVLVLALGIDPEKDVYISYLPMAHILALVVHSVLFSLGVPIGYGNPRTLTDANVRNCKGDLRELQPTLFVGVPTVFERIKAGVERKIKASPIAHLVFKNALKLKILMKKCGLPGTGLLDMLIFNKLKREVGGKIRFFVSGGAALSNPVQEFMEMAFGIRTVQGYGLTETSGPACVQEYTDTTVGSVGPPTPAVQIKLVDVPDMGYFHTSNPPRGEVWMKGIIVSKGYYKCPEETEKSFIDGWFRTGDVGEWTPDGALRIVDRIKNLIKPPHGEYVALEGIESKYRNCEFVEHICAYVDSIHNDVVAVVYPNKMTLSAWAKKNKIDDSDHGEICNNPELNKAILKSLHATARTYKMKSIETVRAVYIASEEWTSENDMLTAAQKLKRNNVVQAYRKQIDDMYTRLESN